MRGSIAWSAGSTFEDHNDSTRTRDAYLAPHFMAAVDDVGRLDKERFVVSDDEQPNLIIIGDVKVPAGAAGLTS